VDSYQQTFANGTRILSAQPGRVVQAALKFIW